MANKIDDGVITFAQIWRVFKSCLARAAIYVVVSAIVCFAVLYAVRTVTVDKTYSATITFKQSDENIKSTLESNKASAVSSAINSVYGDSDTADAVYDDILSTLVISAYIPSERADDADYIATAYTVTFDDVEVSGVNSASQLSLLENICNNLCESYAKAYAPDAVISEEVWGYAPDIDSTEYIDVAYELSERLDNLIEAINASIDANSELSSDFSTFKSTEAGSGSRSVAEIVAQLENISITVNKVTQNIISLGIYNSDAAFNGTAYAEYLANQLKNEYAELDAIIQEYRNHISVLEAAIGNFTSTSSSLITVDLTALLEVLTEELIPLVSEQSAVATKQDEVAIYITALQTSTLDANSATNAAYMVTVESTLNSVIDSVDSAIDAYNALVTEYNSSMVISTYAAISKSPTASDNALVSISMLLILVIAVAVVAFVVAFGQTWSRMKRAGTLNSDPEPIFRKKPAPEAKQE